MPRFEDKAQRISNWWLVLFGKISNNREFMEIIEKELDELGYFDAPASTKHHLNYEGGLYEHSCNVTDALLNLTRDMGIEWSRPQSPYIIGMFHDLCKADAYMPNEELDFPPCKYNNDTLYKGHGEKSVLMLSSILRLTGEEIACITYHMGAFTDKEKWSDYTNAIHKYPNVLWTHTADMIATHIMEV